MNMLAEIQNSQNKKVFWPQLHQQLKRTLNAPLSSHDFLESIRDLDESVAHLANENMDASLFVLVQMLHEKNLSYSATHALLCATLCRVMNAQTQLAPEALPSLSQAALTMNIGMSSLHDQLALQVSKVTTEQQTAIADHPEVGWQMLRGKGVQNDTWLDIVRNHHAPDTQTLHTATRMLQLADIFVGSISPRSTRPALLSKQGVLKIYKSEEGKPDSLGAVFVKAVGIYVPGSYVKLANGEIAVVVKRGGSIHTPHVAPLIGVRGAPIQEPVLIDTAAPTFEIKESIAAPTVRLRTNWETLLNKFF